MNDERIAHRICQGLNHGLDDIPPSVLRRLEASRHHALAHQKQAEPELALAASKGSVAFGGELLRSTPARQALAAALLLLGMAIGSYWHAHQYISDIEDVDSALLTDSIPPEAFLDKGFAAWLNDSSED